MGRRMSIAAAGAVVVVAGLYTTWQRVTAMDWLSWAQATADSFAYHGLQIMRLRVNDTLWLNSWVRVSHTSACCTRLDYLGPDLAGLQVTFAANKVYRSDPVCGRSIMADSTPATVPLDLRGYRVQRRRSGPVDGRPTVLLRLARDGLVRRLWLDRATGVVLRSQTSNRAGIITETAYTKFAVDAPTTKPCRGHASP